MKRRSSHLLDNLSNCLMNLKNSGDSTGFKPMTSAMPVQCSNQLSYEVTQWRAGQFVGLVFSRKRNVCERNVICSATALHITFLSEVLMALVQLPCTHTHVMFNSISLGDAFCNVVLRLQEWMTGREKFLFASLRKLL